MTSSQQDVYRFEHADEGIMTRTMDGIISFWNQGAEKLYGWRKEEAIGKVSHDLLQTQFPQPLEEIESELVRNGRWEGKLVHTTRRGGRVAVQSRWSLDPTGQPEEVVEINARSNDYEIDPATGIGGGYREETGRPKPSATAKAKATKENARSVGRIHEVAQMFVPATLLCLVVVWFFYALFGRLLIHAMYTSQSIRIVDELMPGRTSSPVENYYWSVEGLLWFGTIQILAICAVAWLAIRNLRGAILTGFSLLLSSLVLFGTFEMFPSLIKLVHLDGISPYFAFKANYIYDEGLLFREKPFNQSVTVDFKGADYSPIYGIDVPSTTIEWKTDENGFRNSGKTDVAEIVIMGDSYMEYGDNESDTFPKRLQQKLPGLTVMNLGKSGYGPFQYLEVLKRFGLKYNPRYAFFAFYEGNDLYDIRSYRLWKAGKLGTRDIGEVATQDSFWGRYWVMLKTTARHLSEPALVYIHAALGKNRLAGGTASKIHPDLAALNLGDGHLYMAKLADTSTRSANEMFEQENWVALERILGDFKSVCLAHQITPIVLYVPSASHIYAEFSTTESGWNWLAVREREITTKENTENAVARLVSAAGLDFISLSPVLSRAALAGKLVYQPLDSHWNSEGRELAAAFVADVLRSKYSLLPTNKTN